VGIEQIASAVEAEMVGWARHKGRKFVVNGPFSPIHDRPSDCPALSLDRGVLHARRRTYRSRASQDGFVADVRGKDDGK
jgi:hypothetical protein